MTTGEAQQQEMGIHRVPSTLGALAASLRQTSKAAPQIPTKEFIVCCDTILPFFDHLGPVFHVARSEFQGKLSTLKQQCDSKPHLKDIVDADKHAKQATVKNSATRNLHRLAAAILFVKVLFEKLLQTATAAGAAHTEGSAAAAAVTLREAACAAYEEALAPIHTTIVRGVVRTGMMTLPSREQFMQSIGETEETALIYAQDLVAACQAVHSSVTKLFEGIDMPSSSVWMWPGK